MQRIDCHTTARRQKFLEAMSFLAIAAGLLPSLSAAQASPPPPINWGTANAGGQHSPSTAAALGNPKPSNSTLGSRLGNAATQVPVPTNLHRGANAQECRAHGQADCSQLNYPTYVLLVWNADPAATSYHVYRTDSGSPQPLAMVQPQPTGASSSLPSAFGIANVSAGTCYAVTESKGNVEGSMSATWCMPSTLGAAAAANTFSAPPGVANASAAMNAPPIANRWGTPASGAASGTLTTSNQRSSWSPAAALAPPPGQPAGRPPVGAGAGVSAPLPSPLGLTRTTDMAECTAHTGRAGAQMCAQMRNPNYVLLIWNAVKAASGYNIYRTDSGSKVSAGAAYAANGFVASGFGIANVAVGACYAVSAVVNAAEGDLSPQWCLQASGVAPGSSAATVGKNIASATTPSTPTQLHTTTSAQECTQHQGNFICGALQGGAQTLTVLVWTGEKAAQKYTVYQIPKGSAAVAIGSNTGAINGVISTAYSVDKVTAGTCFTVSETLDGHESAQSSTACPGTSAQSTTLRPLYVQSYGTEQDGKCSAYSIAAGYAGQVTQPGRLQALIVGYGSVNLPCTGDFNAKGVMPDNSFYRGGIFFDLTSFAGRKILRAVLVLPVASSKTSKGSLTSCTTMVSTGASQWWNDAGQINEGPLSADPTQLAGQVDVTAIVSAWVSGAARGGADNDGFVLSGSTEDLGSMSGSCLTTYGNPTLVLTAQ
jgi:hypothetical protein